MMTQWVQNMIGRAIVAIEEQATVAKIRLLDDELARWRPAGDMDRLQAQKAALIRTLRFPKPGE